jgi:hypothetical protein
LELIYKAQERSTLQFRSTSVLLAKTLLASLKKMARLPVRPVLFALATYRLE